MNTWVFKLYQIVAAAILLQLSATGAMAADKAKEIDWAAFNPDIKGATFVQSSTECLECPGRLHCHLRCVTPRGPSNLWLPIQATIGQAT